MNMAIPSEELSHWDVFINPYCYSVKIESREYLSFMCYAWNKKYMLAMSWNINLKENEMPLKISEQLGGV